MSFSIGSPMLPGGPRGMLERFGSEEKEGPLFNVRVVKRILSYLRPHSGGLLVAVALMLVQTGLILLAPYLMKVAIDTAIPQGDVAQLTTLALWTGMAYIGLYGSDTVQKLLLGWIGQRALTDLRADLFEHLQMLSMSFHDRQIVGVTVSRVINDVAEINELLSEGLITLLGDLLVLIGIIVVMVSLSPILALLTFTVLPVMVLATLYFAGRARLAYRETRSKVAAVVGDLAEDIAGVRVIQAFTQEQASQARFERINEANRDANIDAVSLSFIFLPTIEFLGIAATAIVLWFGGQAVLQNQLTVGVMVAFLAYVTRLFQPILEMSRIYTTLQSAMAGGEAVVRMLDTPTAVADRLDAVDLPPIRGEIDFERVHFAYSAGAPEVVHDVSLHIPAGATVAFVGPTGAGKTTLINLVARFYDVTSGAVRIDGVDVREVRQRSLRGQLGLVPQDPFLFSRSVADNIRFGRTTATDAEVEEAARLANAHDFIVALPAGYATPVLEGGVNLSVGQRQLICIARAILAEPRLVILDEATANIDTGTESMIQDALERLLRGRTALVIAHRLSTIRSADLICVVQGGAVVEQGRHEDLLARGGLYATLHQSQFGAA